MLSQINNGTSIKIISDRKEKLKVIINVKIGKIIASSPVIMVFMKLGSLWSQSCPGCMGTTRKPNRSVIFLTIKIRREH